jgi:hypothetical protein
MPRDDASKRKEWPGGSDQSSGGLGRRFQGTWMGARRTKRGRGAGNAARAGRWLGKEGAHAGTGDGIVSHRQHIMRNANSTLFSL